MRARRRTSPRVDVTDPRDPKVVVQTDLPQPYMRSNSLELTGDIMAVAYQTKKPGQQPAGFELFDISMPENPKSISFFDCSGPYSRGVHQLWFCDGEYVHLASGARDFQPRNPKDDQFYRIIDVRNPSKPTEVGRWWMPGTREGDTEAPKIERHTAPALDTGFRAHNTNVYPQRPDRCYLGYLDAGMYILDISDKSLPRVDLATGTTRRPIPASPTPCCRCSSASCWSSPTRACATTARTGPKLIWILDGGTSEPGADQHLPDAAAARVRGPRRPLRRAQPAREHAAARPAGSPKQVIVGTFFNGGLRAFDIADPYAPKEVAHFVPEAPRGSPVGVDPDQRRLHRRARHRLQRRSPYGGLYMLEMEF